MAVGARVVAITKVHACAMKGFSRSLHGVDEQRVAHDCAAQMRISQLPCLTCTGIATIRIQHAQRGAGDCASQESQHGCRDQPQHRLRAEKVATTKLAGLFACFLIALCYQDETGQEHLYSGMTSRFAAALAQSMSGTRAACQYDNKNVNKNACNELFGAV